MSSSWDPLLHIEEIRGLASLGFTEKQIATKLNVHPDVLRYHRKQTPKLEEAIQQGLNSTIEVALLQLQSLINEGNFTAIKFFLEKKAGWGDTITIESNKPTNQSFQLVPVITDEHTDTTTETPT